MLYEAAVGTAAGWEVAPRYADLLADEPLITYLQATATEVDATAGTVTVVPAGGVGAPVALPYDRLVVAVGGRPTQPDIPGLKEHGLPLHSDGIMPDAAAASRAAGAAALTAGGVTLVPRTRVAALTDETVTLVSATGPPAGAPERTAPADVVVWTAGAVPATAGLPGVSGGTPLVYLGEMLTLGGGAASVATPFGLSLDGAPAALVRRAAYLARMPTAGHRRRVAASWGSAALLSAVQGLTGWGEAAPDGGRRDSVAPVE
ncbi:hypothetical protein I4F81_005885 [Pyropia yezoensis]|uniref:Uncharacterized protein n=1 Tax=Pyropia yezoensis TaxID=2788 RepID=A0ACC3BZJ6_PYRYE|nr:hypothetical protein I4F81_005885 [Neopyropia yezoensis]